MSTAKLRVSYPELVVDPRIPRCDFAHAVPVPFLAEGKPWPKGAVQLRVHPKTRQIWRAVAATMHYFGYPFREQAGGSVVCRRITGGTGTTLHAHGIAVDWNPSKNAYRKSWGVIQWGRQTDMPAAMVRAIEAITLTNGRHPVQWGGRWTNTKDPMHYQVAVLADQLAPVNLASLPRGAWAGYLAWTGEAPTRKGDPMLGHSIGRTTDPVGPSTPETATLQVMLTDRGFYGGAIDGIGGPITRQALLDWKKAVGITPAVSGGEGRIGPWEYAAFHRPVPGGVDQVARDAAARASAEAKRANVTLDKIRSE